MEVLARIGPAFEQVDSSSGALGTAVRHAIDALVPVLVAAAGAAPAAHVARLERLWLAVEDDGVGYLDAVGDRWGELCADAALAARDRALAAGRALGQHDATAAQLRALVARDAHRSGFVHRLLGGHPG